MAEAQLYWKCDIVEVGYVEGDTWCTATVQDLYQPRVNKDAFWRKVRQWEAMYENTSRKLLE